MWYLSAFSGAQGKHSQWSTCTLELEVGGACTNPQVTLGARQPPLLLLLPALPAQGARAPLGALTCNQCSNRLKDDKLLHINLNFAVAELR